MMDAKIKGGFFQKVLQFAKKKLGSNAMDTLGIDSSQYAPEVWYPFADFCSLLEKVADLMPEENDRVLHRLGRHAMNKDERWIPLFKGKDPKEVFGTNKRQDALMLVGRFEVTKVEKGLITVHMRLWSNDAHKNLIWTDYYRGTLQGVLDLTSKKGEVVIETQEDEFNRICIYNISWS